MFSDTFFYKTVPTPIGAIRLVASKRGLCAVVFGVRAIDSMPADYQKADDHPLLLRAEKQLAEYFTGKRRHFDLPLDMQGSIFQQKVWRELQKIPYAETISYGEQARRLGDVNKARAVGAANGRNPLAIIVPCHRVIGANGDLTGFAGGLKIKQFLLDMETRHAAAKAA